MNKLAKLIKEEFDKAPNNTGDHAHSKNANFLIDAIIEAGLVLHADQNGVSGTFLYLTEKKIE